MNQNAQTFLKVLIGIVLLAGGIATIMILTTNTPTPGESKLMAICFLLLFYGITGSISMATAGKKEHSLLGTAGIIVSGVAFLYTSTLILGETSATILLKLAFCLFIASISLAHICFLYYITIQNKFAFIARILATIFISIFSLFIITVVFELNEGLFFWQTPSETYIRIIFSSLVLDLTATLLVPLCNRLQGPSPAEFVITSEPPPAPAAPASIEEIQG